MIFDRMEKVRVTSDIKKVLPGTVFVDLTERKSSRDIYRAYESGAELIFTAHNITDPELPVVKVGNPSQVYSKLLCKYYEYPQRDASLIALGGSRDKNVTLNMLETIFNHIDNRDSSFRLDWYKARNGKYIKDAEALMGYLSNKVRSGLDTIPIAIEKNMSLTSFDSDLSFDCCILTNGYSRPEAEVLDNTVARLKTNHLLIINGDENELLKVAEDRKDVLVVTYGLTKKACVTASTIDFADTTSFNYCLQRTMYTIKGRCIEPFEMPFKVNLLGNNNICNALAAITCALYYDKDIEEVQKAMQSFEAAKRKFERVFEGKFKVVDDYCSTPVDLNETLEAIQILNYSRLLIVFSPGSGVSMEDHHENAEILLNWAKVLGCKELILSSGMEEVVIDASVQSKIIRLYRSELKKDEIPVRYYHLPQHAVENALKRADYGDLILVIGGEEMIPAEDMLKEKLLGGRLGENPVKH